MKSKGISFLLVIVVLVAIVIGIFVFYQTHFKVPATTITSTTTSQPGFNQGKITICSSDNDCQNNQFCVIHFDCNMNESVRNTIRGTCTRISPNEEKNCTSTSECGYGYECTQGFWGNPPVNYQTLPTTCQRIPKECIY